MYFTKESQPQRGKTKSTNRTDNLYALAVLANLANLANLGNLARKKKYYKKCANGLARLVDCDLHNEKLFKNETGTE